MHHFTHGCVEFFLPLWRESITMSSTLFTLDLILTRVNLPWVSLQRSTLVLTHVCVYNCSWNIWGKIRKIRLNRGQSITPFTLEKTNSVCLFCVLGKDVTRKRLGNSLFHCFIYDCNHKSHCYKVQGMFEYKQMLFTVQTTLNLP